MLKETRKPIARKTRLRSVSDRRRAELAIYSEKRAVFLRAKPICQVCERAKSRDVHHTQGRLGGNYLDESTWLAVCRKCHDWIHRHPSESRTKGVLR